MVSGFVDFSFDCRPCPVSVPALAACKNWKNLAKSFDVLEEVKDRVLRKMEKERENIV